MSDAAQVWPGYGQVASRAGELKTPRLVVPSGAYATVPGSVQWPLEVSTIVSPSRA